MINDPFAKARLAEGFAQGRFGDEDIPLILRYRDVRQAAADTKRFSSDAPARLPIPDETNVRKLRQLPIEADPPVSEAYKAIVKPWFRRAADASYEDRVRSIVRRVLDNVRGRKCDAIADFALPIQAHALTVLLSVPAENAEEWIGWGVHAFKVNGRNVPEKAQVLMDYIARGIDAAETSPGKDMFSFLLGSEIDGRRLTNEEVAGIMHVTLAGGRDTVINTIVAALDHFASWPNDLARLARDPKLVSTATEEFVRYVTPLTHRGRICPSADNVGGFDVAPNGRVGLCWVSANFDETVFEAPTELRIDRSPNPHVGFGSGPHNCIGSTHARLVIRTVLLELANSGLVVIPEGKTSIPQSIGGFIRNGVCSDLIVRISSSKAGSHTGT